MQGRVGKDGENVFKEDAGRGEVGELAEGASQAYRKTGEFGGAGGGGGGESSFGGIGSEGWVWLRGGRMRGRCRGISSSRGGG